MKTTNRLLFLIALISSFIVTSAQANSEHKAYLVALNDEVTSAYPDKKNVLIVNQHIGTQPELIDNRVLPLQSSNDILLTAMKIKYPASRRIFDLMPIHYQNQVLTNYQVHLDINKFRQEMMGILRNR